MINHSQSERSIARCCSQRRRNTIHNTARRRSSILRSTSGLLHTTSGSQGVTMTSQNERESMKNGCALELQPFDGKNCSDQLRNSDSYHAQGHGHPTMSNQFGRRTTDSSTIDSAVRCPTNFFCTPHSIEDILSRPRRVHDSSLLLPESRGTSGHVAQGRLFSWSIRSSEEVRRLAQRTGDDELRWKSMYWSQHSPGSQARLAAATPTRRGTTEMMMMMMMNDDISNSIAMFI